MIAPITHSVYITGAAKRDLREIVRWIAEHDSQRAAVHVLDKLQSECRKLQLQPERGAFPAELLALGIKRYRQVLFKPYRVIYRVLDDNVAVMLIVDGRRNLKSLLERRLLSA